ncbi:ABC transporter permease [Iamia sp.]|uniref:ABC transporter permease n=1 Tax=Iamia sp. TaxID=2722710 RepID=UPI002C284710|nr:ABC transporter permease [Iamia sp.]HXH58279.1 ABC transporter permease [Iamia sp.]
MLGFTIRRLAQAVPVIFCAISLLFFLFYVLPGDPVTILSGGTGRNVPEVTRQNIEQKYGFDKSIPEQFATYWGNVATGDLGDSLRDDQPVWDKVKQFAPNSIRLAFWALVLEAFFGIGIGMVSAVKRYSVIDTVTTLLSTIAMAIPVFVSGYLIIYVFGITAFQRGWPEWIRFPTGRTPENWAFFFFPADEESFRRLVPPAVALALIQIAVVARMTRTTMLETINTDYVRTARAKGLTERSVVFKHGLRNALIPVVTLIGLDFGTLIGSAVLTETVFSYNGLGSQIVRAAQFRDAPVVLGLTLVVVIAYLVVNLIVDLSYGVLDPRIRYDD